MKPKKSLGQNFLISEQVVNEIVESSKIDTLIEIIIKNKGDLKTILKFKDGLL